MIVYKLENVITGKSYIGQTSQPLRRRFSGHIYKTNPFYLGRTIRKYGVKNFKVEQLCFCETKEQMDIQENFYINYYNTIRPDGYNLTYGGEGTIGFKHSKESIERGASKKRGRKFSLEIRKRMSEAQKGIKKPGTSRFVKEKNTFWWKIITPEGQEMFVRDMKNYCRENGLDQGAMSRVASGERVQYKQYKCVKIGRIL